MLAKRAGMERCEAATRRNAASTRLLVRFSNRGHSTVQRTWENLKRGRSKGGATDQPKTCPLARMKNTTPWNGTTFGGFFVSVFRQLPQRSTGRVEGRKTYPKGAVSEVDRSRVVDRRLLALLKPGYLRADSKSGYGSVSGWRRAIASSAVMSCITACRPSRIEPNPARRSRFMAAVRSVAMTLAPFPR